MTRRARPIEVLVVDDSAVDAPADEQRCWVAHVGVHVTTASDPLVAMAKMRRHRPHVILLDLEMPRMDGITFLKQIMATDPIPVVVCSGFAEPGTNLAMRALAAGAVDIVPKPRLFASGLGRGQRPARRASARRPRRASVRRAPSASTTLPGWVAAASAADARPSGRRCARRRHRRSPGGERPHHRHRRLDRRHRGAQGDPARDAVRRARAS